MIGLIAEGQPENHADTIGLATIEIISNYPCDEAPALNNVINHEPWRPKLLSPNSSPLLSLSPKLRISGDAPSVNKKGAITPPELML